MANNKVRKEKLFFHIIFIFPFKVFDNKNTSLIALN